MPAPSPAPTTQPRTAPVRARGPPSEHVQVVRELWVLRERGAVRALENSFLMRLAQIIDGGGERARVARGDSYWVRPSENEDDTRPSSPTRAREPPAGASRRDADAARIHARVTRLSPEFRARLEGLANDQTNSSTLQRTASWGALLAQRMVTSTLGSAFRHELEGVLVRRGSRATQAYAAGRHDGENAAPNQHMEIDGRVRADTQAAVRALREEVAGLRRVIDASFDVQLDIQRAVRQEVAAALHAPSRSATCASSCATAAACLRRDDGAAPHTHDDACTAVATQTPRATRAVGVGSCSICMDRRIDSLLYACGHMCTCAPCGRQLLAHGDSCPMCRAPVRDVVVAYIAT